MIPDVQKFAPARHSVETIREGLPVFKITVAGLCSIGFHGLCAAAFVFATQYSVPTEIPTSIHATLHTEEFLEQYGLVNDHESTPNTSQSLVESLVATDEANTATEGQLPDTVRSEFAPDYEAYYEIETANIESPQELSDNPVTAESTSSHAVVEPEIFVDLEREIAVVPTSGEFMLVEQQSNTKPVESPKLQQQVLADVAEPARHESTQSRPSDYELEIATSEYVPTASEHLELENQDSVDDVEQRQAENSPLAENDSLAVQNQTVHQTESFIDHESAIQVVYGEFEPASEVAVVETNAKPATENIPTIQPEKTNLQVQIASKSQLNPVATDTQPSHAPNPISDRQPPASERENESAPPTKTVAHESIATTDLREPTQLENDIGNNLNSSEAHVAAYQGQFNQPVYGVEGLSNPKPRYPYLSRVNSEEGKVVLQVYVSRTGDVSRIEIQQSSGHHRLDKAAQKAVGKWKFKPAQIAGLATAGTVQVPITFVLSN